MPKGYPNVTGIKVFGGKKLDSLNRYGNVSNVKLYALYREEMIIIFSLPVEARTRKRIIFFILDLGIL